MCVHGTFVQGTFVQGTLVQGTLVQGTGAQMVRILLADDDATVRELAQRALSGEGHDVVAVSDGLEAMDQLKVQAFDLVISDLDMPGLDGMGLAAKVISGLSGAKILLISGLEDELRRAGGFPSDRVATLQKPFSLDQLRRTVRGLLGG